METGLLGSGGDVETKGSPFGKGGLYQGCCKVEVIGKSQNQCEIAGVMQSSELVFLLWYIIQGSVAPVRSGTN